MRKIDQEGILRVLDANFNRTKEGLRVCEDLCRFYLNLPILTKQFKEIRHKITEIVSYIKLDKIISSRNVNRDVGKETIASESKRADVKAILYANIQRSKESIRVLEELLKLYNHERALKLKNIRYKLYSLEKKVVKKI